MSLTLSLPIYAGKLEDYQLVGTPLEICEPKAKFNRVAFAAAHVVADPIAERNPWSGTPAIDWDSTLRFRHYLWDQGLFLAEAMDTAQRGMGVPWEVAKQLIERTLLEAKTHKFKPRVACGAGTDHKQDSELKNLDEVIAAYSEQMAVIEQAGGESIIMASSSLPALNATAEQYYKVYTKLITQASGPVILHWLGVMFNPKLAGYWGSTDLAEATATVLAIINEHKDKVDGIKISLLDEQHEISFRNQLPAGVRLYTGDDFNYTKLIAPATDGSYSDALLGIFAAIAPAAAQALAALAAGDQVGYQKLLQPTEALSREIFKSPTCYYKAGVTFLVWLNGLQKHFVMPAGLQSAREITHYAEIFRLADVARLLTQPQLACQRMNKLLELNGIETK